MHILWLCLRSTIHRDVAHESRLLMGRDPFCKPSYSDQRLPDRNSSRLSRLFRKHRDYKIENNTQIKSNRIHSLAAETTVRIRYQTPYSHNWTIKLGQWLKLYWFAFIILYKPINALLTEFSKSLQISLNLFALLFFKLLLFCEYQWKMEILWMASLLVHAKLIWHLGQTDHKCVYKYILLNRSFSLSLAPGGLSIEFIIDPSKSILWN